MPRDRARNARWDDHDEAFSQGALYAALGLLTGGLAALFGGRMAAVEPTVTGPSQMAMSSIGPQGGM